MMKSQKAPQESPEAVAKRQREELRADKANLSTTQNVLDGLTRRYSRRFGLVKPSGSQQNIVGGLNQLAGAANAGGTFDAGGAFNPGFTGGYTYNGGSEKSYGSFGLLY